MSEQWAILTPEEIRGMDGPALTRLAYQLGLAMGALAMQDPRAGTMYIVDWIGREFRPHTNMRQADAVFRQLRAQHFVTEIRGNYEGGTCLVIPQCHAPKAIQTWWAQCADRDNLIDGSEALALLRCACLAVVSEGDMSAQHAE